MQNQSAPGMKSEHEILCSAETKGFCLIRGSHPKTKEMSSQIASVGINSRGLTKLKLKNAFKAAKRMDKNDAWRNRCAVA
jgi:hypothetical protein